MLLFRCYFVSTKTNTMKTKHTTLISPMSENIGQVRIQYAFDEIIRLNEQENTNSWRIDTSDCLFVPDETMREVKNPCPLSNGYVWVTKTRELSKAEKCANELLDALQIFVGNASINGYFTGKSELYEKVTNAIKKATE